MELKPNTIREAAVQYQLLIVPYGIETTPADTRQQS